MRIFNFVRHSLGACRAFFDQVEVFVNTALSPLSSRVTFVLVAPSHPGNIGSAARAVKTMGFTDLRVVAPKVADYKTHPDAVAFSTSSVDVLQASRSYAVFADALEDVSLAFAMTGYSR